MINIIIRIVYKIIKYKYIIFKLKLFIIGIYIRYLKFIILITFIF